MRVSSGPSLLLGLCLAGCGAGGDGAGARDRVALDAIERPRSQLSYHEQRNLRACALVDREAVLALFGRRDLGTEVLDARTGRSSCTWRTTRNERAPNHRLAIQVFPARDYGPSTTSGAQNGRPRPLRGIGSRAYVLVPGLRGTVETGALVRPWSLAIGYTVIADSTRDPVYARARARRETVVALLRTAADRLRARGP